MEQRCSQEGGFGFETLIINVNEFHHHYNFLCQEGYVFAHVRLLVGFSVRLHKIYRADWMEDGSLP